MNENLAEIIDDIQKNIGNYEELGEFAIKQVVILRVLQSLGWNIFDLKEVKPEFPLNIVDKNGKVDYSLRIGEINKVFLEIKKSSAPLEKHQGQLLDYAFAEGVKLAILTNGLTWWFYLSLCEGGWEQRKFYTIDFVLQNSVDIVNNFDRLLSKEKIRNGRAYESAERDLIKRKDEKTLKTTIPKVWDEMVSQPNIKLVELLVEETEKMYGYRPSIDLVEKFMSNIDEIKYPSNETKVIIDPQSENTDSESFYNTFYNTIDQNSKEIIDAINSIINNIGDKQIYPEDRAQHFALKYMGSNRGSWLVMKRAGNGIGLWIRVDPKMFSDHENRFTKITNEGTAKTHGNFHIVFSNKSEIDDYVFSKIKESYDFRSDVNYLSKWREILNVLGRS